MSVIMGIDPGPEQSGWCLYGNGVLVDCGVDDNHELMHGINDMGADWLTIESVESYGMAVGREVFETCIWIGRLQQAWHQPAAVHLIPRKAIKVHLCGTTKAKDSNIRQAILDQFPRAGGGKTPQVGTKAQPGPLFGIKSHAWSALALAITCEHQLRAKEAA